MHFAQGQYPVATNEMVLVPRDGTEGGELECNPKAFWVWGPTIPSTPNPASRWNVITAEWVLEPKIPSAFPHQYPLALRACCTSTTAFPREPMDRLGSAATACWAFNSISPVKNNDTIKTGKIIFLLSIKTPF